MKTTYIYEKPDIHGTFVQLAGLGLMFGGMIVGDVIFNNLIAGFFGGFAAFLAVIAAYVRYSEQGHELSEVNDDL